MPLLSILFDYSKKRLILLPLSERFCPNVRLVYQTTAKRRSRFTMVLNWIWIALILLAVLMGIVQAAVYGNVEIFSEILNSTFSGAKTGFEISLGLTGVLSLWMGIMKIGEQAGVIRQMSRLVSPFFHRIFPELPKQHPAYGGMLMNISATMLGIDNAATPLGLQAMRELQESNPDKNRASNSMIMFLVLVTSGLTLVPVSIMTYRAQLRQPIQPMYSCLFCFPPILPPSPGSFPSLWRRRSTSSIGLFSAHWAVWRSLSDWSCGQPCLSRKR